MSSTTSTGGIPVEQQSAASVSLEQDSSSRKRSRLWASKGARHCGALQVKSFATLAPLEIPLPLPE